MLQEQLIFVYFFSGLAFFLLGIVTWVEAKRKSKLEFTKALPYLSAFGIFQAFAEWMHMFEKVPPHYLGIENLKIIIILKISFAILAYLGLFLFGLALFKQHFKSTTPIIICKGLIISYLLYIGYLFTFLGFDSNVDLAASLGRYLLAFPSGLLAGAGMWREGQNNKSTNLPEATKGFKIAGAGFVAYGAFSLLCPQGSSIFAFNPFHAELLLKTFGIPIQFIRACLAVIITFYSFRALSSYEQEHHRNLQARITNLEILSSYDEVSGLYNHRFFQESLKRLCELGHRDKTTFSLLLIDIDYFKEYNDNYGHPEGDKLLNEVGRMIRSLIRSSDIVARYGGDELAVILQSTHLVEAYDVAEKIRRDIHSHCFAGSANKRITLSIGVANFPSCAETKEELVQVADTALYKAKIHRNKTECHSLFG